MKNDIKILVLAILALLVLSFMGQVITGKAIWGKTPEKIPEKPSITYQGVLSMLNKCERTAVEVNPIEWNNQGLKLPTGNSICGTKTCVVALISEMTERSRSPPNEEAKTRNAVLWDCSKQVYYQRYGWQMFKMDALCC